MRINKIFVSTAETVWDHGVVNGKGTSTLKVTVCTDIFDRDFFRFGLKVGCDKASDTLHKKIRENIPEVKFSAVVDSWPSIFPINIGRSNHYIDENGEHNEPVYIFTFYFEDPENPDIMENVRKKIENILQETEL